MTEFRKDKVIIDGSRLKTLRKKKGIKKRIDLSYKTNIPVSNLCFAENRAKTVSIIQINKIAKAPNLKIDDFYHKKIITPLPVRKVREKIEIIKINIFNYNNISEILQEWYKENKRKEFFFSYRFLQKKLDCRSMNEVYRIMNGYRIPSNKMVKKLKKVMNLSTNEAIYFKKLIRSSRKKKKGEIVLPSF